MATKFKRNKIIDKKFQKKHTYSIISFSVIAFIIVIAILGINAGFNNRQITRTTINLNNINKSVDTSLIELKKSIKTEDDIINSFLKYSRSLSISNGIILDTKSVQNDHSNTIKGMNKYTNIMKGFTSNIDLLTKNLKEMNVKNMIIIIIIISIVIILSIFLYIYLINFTHRISGPMFVLTRHIQTILDGEKPEFRKLREKDEFQIFYEKFVVLAAKYFHFTNINNLIKEVADGNLNVSIDKTDNIELDNISESFLKLIDTLKEKNKTNDLDISNLTSSIKKIANGDLSIILDKPDDPDLSNLINSFNQILSELKIKNKLVEELKEKENIPNNKAIIPSKIINENNETSVKDNKLLDLFKLGVKHLKNNDLDNSEAIFKSLTLMDPEEFSSFFNLGVTYAKKREFELSLEMFETAKKLNPSYDTIKEYIEIIKNQNSNI